MGKNIQKPFKAHIFFPFTNPFNASFCHSSNSILITPLNPETHLELSVALGVFEHVQEELCTLLGPTALSPVKLLGLKTHTHTQPLVRRVSHHARSTLLTQVAQIKRGLFHPDSKGVLRWSSLQHGDVSGMDSSREPSFHKRV